MSRGVTVCSVAGCPDLAPSGTSRCAEHERQADLARGTRHQRGYDNRWARHSKRYLRAHPSCVLCGAPSEHTDHIDGLGPLGPRGYDDTNLRALCQPCHNRITHGSQPT